MHILQQYFHAIGAFNALILGLLLVATNGLNRAGKILAFWCFAWSIYAMSPLLLINTNAQSLGLVHIWILWIPASFGAFLYLYLIFAINNRPFKTGDLLKFTPLVICLLLNLDYASMSTQQFADFRNQGAEFDIQHVIAFAFLHAQAMFFFIKSSLLIKDYKRQAESNLSNFNPKIFSGLLVIVAANAFLWLLELTSALLGGIFWLSLLSDILFTLYLCILGLIQWKVPAFFVLEVIEPDQKNEVENRNQPKSILDEDSRAEIYSMIVDHMQTNQPFLDSELNLNKFSQQLGLSRHYISEVINKSSKSNFHKFVNQYRVEWFCVQLHTQPNSKILDLALDSGFSSKSAFNLVFKQITGKTPSQYKTNLNA